MYIAFTLDVLPFGPCALLGCLAFFVACVRAQKTSFMALMVSRQELSGRSSFRDARESSMDTIVFGRNVRNPRVHRGGTRS